MFNNKSILVTGATGSFGTKFLSIFTKKYKPKRLIVFSRDEYKQYLLNKIFNQPYMRYFIGDVRDYDRLNDAFRDVDYVVHAAAMKQISASEYNPAECIKTNINGAKNIINAAINQNVKKVIALSTDKAVNPINLYGATKLASDKLFVSANNFVGGKNTLFSVTRYGNVINSRGSVIELFKKIKQERKKIYPITHVDMTRFFIKQEDAVTFVLNNFQRMRGGEIFVPKMPSLKIKDLIKTIDKNAQIKIIGIRPGEKIHEMLCNNEEARNTIEFKKYFIIKPDSIAGYTKNINYLKSINEKGRKVKGSFLYRSDLNPDLLSNKEIKKLL